MIYSGESNLNFWETCGVFINPNNKSQWSTQPYNLEQRQVKEIYDHLEKEKHGLHVEMELIENKQSKLSASQRILCEEIFNRTYN